MGSYASGVSVAEVIDDLLSLDHLLDIERAAACRRSLEAIRDRIAHHAGGAKVSEAAAVLRISQPTVRACIECGLLTTLPGSKPVRIDLAALAETKRALDLISDHSPDRRLLVHVVRLLRARDALDGADEGFAELRARRVVPLGHK